jgi:uncharacterized protein (DUF58 family)
MLERYHYYNYRAFSSLKPRITRRITMVGWMIGAAFLATGSMGIDTSNSLSYQTFALLGCVLCAAILGTRGRRLKMSVDRTLPKFGAVGRRLNYEITVHNQSRHTARGLNFYEQLPDPRPNFEEFALSREPYEDKRNWFDRSHRYYRWRWLLGRNVRAGARERTLPDIPPKQSRTIQADMIPLRRGVLRLNGSVIARTDPFGLFRSLHSVTAPQSVLILPKLYDMPPFELPGSTRYQQGGVSLASSVGESEEFVSLREYRPGDPLRKMHWKSFAKAGKPIVKEFQDEFFVRHAMILDTFGDALHTDIFEEAVSVAASLAFNMQNHDTLLDLMFVGPQAYCFTAGRGLAHMQQMLEILASVQLCLDKKFETLEESVLDHCSQVSGAICIFLQWDEARKRLVRILNSRGIPLRVFVITEGDVKLDPGPLAHQAENFRALPVGKIGERLNQPLPSGRMEKAA